MVTLVKIYKQKEDLNPLLKIDPKTATPKSQKEMMELILDTRKCILTQLKAFEKGK